MAVSLVIEDGSIIDGANSWVSAANARVYAENRGVTLDADDDVLGAQLIRAADYINGFRDRFNGRKVDETQTMQFPRADLFIDGFLFSYLAIPQEVISAQVELAIAAASGIDPLEAQESGLPIIRDKTDVLETEWASPATLGGSSWKSPTLKAVDDLLRPLLRNGFAVTSVRV